MVEREQLISKYLKLERNSHILFVVGYGIMCISFPFIIIMWMTSGIFLLSFSIGVVGCLYTVRYRDMVYRMAEMDGLRLGE